MTESSGAGLEVRDVDERTILLLVRGDAGSVDGDELVAAMTEGVPSAVVLTASRDEALERLELDSPRA